MRSRPARLSLSALAWVALGAAAFFTFHAQQQIDERRTAFRAFASSARDASDALTDTQAGQQAYVALGQEPREWTAKVATYLQTAGTSIDALRASARSSAAGPSLLDASTAMARIGDIDKRLRQQLAAREHQAAAEAVFSEAADAIAGAASNLSTAIGAEQQAADDFEAGTRRAQVLALGGAAGLSALILALLGLVSPVVRVFAADVSAVDADTRASADTADPFPDLAHSVHREAPTDPPVAAQPADVLKTIADICTEFGRVGDAAQLKGLLEQAASLMNARGLIVWLGSAEGADLRPVLAYGYSDATLARIPPLARASDNVAAQAYRTGDVQIVNARPGASQGVVVAPLLGPSGCIGALTAEIRERGEESATTRALALIVAAQLSGVLATAAEGASVAPPESQSAVR